MIFSIIFCFYFYCRFSWLDYCHQDTLCQVCCNFKFFQCNKYFYVFGSDWRFIGGIKEGISPTSSKGVHQKIALNTPIEATFSSTNPFKWPQIVVACYGPDIFGNDVIRGYGSTFLPTVPGKTERKVADFTPVALTTMNKIVGFFVG